MWSKTRVAVLLAIIVGIGFGARPAEAYIELYNGDLGEISITGFARTQVDIHTANRNPNNSLVCGGSLASGNAACVPSGINNASLQLFRTWLLTDTLWKTPFNIPNLKFYMRTRVWADMTQAADGTLQAGNANYDAFPNRFRRDGWYGQAASDQFSFQLWEAWGDYNFGDFWVRLGRQNIVWGDVAPTRLLDDINPLDVSWHLVLEPLGKDVFDHLRIPLWAARGAYNLPFSLGDFLNAGSHVEGYIIPGFAFTATQLPGTGDVGAPTNGVYPISRSPSPLNVVPPFLKVSRDPSEGMQGVSTGFRMVATALGGRINYTLNFISRRNVEGLGTSQGFLPDQNGFSPIGGIVFIKNKHPRFQTFGISGNYYEQWSKVVAVFEGIWDFKRPFEAVANAESSSEIRRRHNWSYVISLNRPGFYFRSDRATTVALVQFQQVIRERGRGAISSAGVRLKPTTEIFTVLLTQAFRWPTRGDEIFLDLAFLADLDNSFAFVPLFRWEPGNNWRFNLWYNAFFGNECDQQDEAGRCGVHGITTANPGGFGSNAPFQGFNMSVSYQY